MGASILYRTPPKIGKKSTPRSVQNDFFSLEMYFFEIGFEESAFFYVDWSGLGLKSSFERPIHEKSDFFLIFRPSKSSIFRLYSHSRGVSHHFQPSLSSLPIGKSQPQLRPPKMSSQFTTLTKYTGARFYRKNTMKTRSSILCQCGELVCPSILTGQNRRGHMLKQKS